MLRVKQALQEKALYVYYSFIFFRGGILNSLCYAHINVPLTNWWIKLKTAWICDSKVYILSLLKKKRKEERKPSQQK
jgi:hypothetical protein